MSQNSIIAFGLLAGFIVFITVRGELPRYLAVIGLEPGAAGAGSPAGAVATSTLPSLPDFGAGSLGGSVGSLGGVMV